MSRHTGIVAFVRRHLDPVDRLGEMLFGLIMVLTVTLGAGLATDPGEAGVRQLLIAALGCNLAWGLIDGGMYVLNAMFERGRKARLLRAVKSAPNEAAALAVIESELDPILERLSDRDDRARLYRGILRRLVDYVPTRTRLTKDEVYGGVACFVLVFVSALPAAVPFMLLRDPRLALRLSNLLLIGMLFLIGHRWAHYTNASPLRAGLSMVLIGGAMVCVAILLGG